MPVSVENRAEPTSAPESKPDQPQAEREFRLLGPAPRKWRDATLAAILMLIPLFVAGGSRPGRSRAAMVKSKFSVRKMPERARADVGSSHLAPSGWRDAPLALLFMSVFLAALSLGRGVEYRNRRSGDDPMAPYGYRPRSSEEPWTPDPQAATAGELPMSSESEARLNSKSNRHLPPQLIEVWGYSIALSVILGSVGVLLSGSSEILIPVIAVCFAGGVIGSVLAFIRSLQNDRTGIFR
jgi:hypothetical protein